MISEKHIFNKKCFLLILFLGFLDPNNPPNGFFLALSHTVPLNSLRPIVCGPDAAAGFFMSFAFFSFAFFGFAFFIAGFAIFFGDMAGI
jgi:hypothetical protein